MHSSFVCLRQCKDITVFLTMHYVGNPGLQVLKPGYDGTQDPNLEHRAPLLTASDSQRWFSHPFYPSFGSFHSFLKNASMNQTNRVPIWEEDRCERKRRMRHPKQTACTLCVEKKDKNWGGGLNPFQNRKIFAFTSQLYSYCTKPYVQGFAHPLPSGLVVALMVFGIQYVLRCK